MAAQDHLSTRQFGDYGLTYRGANARGVHTIWATHKGDWVGGMEWRHGHGVIGVDVLPEHQRKGVATAMWNMAIDLKKKDKSIPAIKHSTDRTEQGDNWAKKVGRYYRPDNIIGFEKD